MGIRSSQVKITTELHKAKAAKHTTYVNRVPWIFFADRPREQFETNQVMTVSK